MSEAKAITDATFEQEVLKASGPVLVDFWAPWCGPCKMMAPVLDSVAGKYGDKVKVVKLNTDENPKSAGQFQISGIPSLLLFKSGTVLDRVVGYVPEGSLAKFLDKHVGTKTLP